MTKTNKMMYHIAIGNINWQNRYKVITSNGENKAKELAWKRHKELGRTTKGNVHIYVELVRPYFKKEA